MTKFNGILALAGGIALLTSVPALAQRSGAGSHGGGVSHASGGVRGGSFGGGGNVALGNFRGGGAPVARGGGNYRGGRGYYRGGSYYPGYAYGGFYGYPFAYGYDGYGYDGYYGDDCGWVWSPRARRYVEVCD